MIEAYLAVVATVPLSRSMGFIEALERGQPVREAASGTFSESDFRVIDALNDSSAEPSEIGRDLRLLYTALNRDHQRPEIVWTGPSVPKAASIRATFPVARALVSEARSELIIAGYVAHIDLLQRLGLMGALHRRVATTIMLNDVDMDDPAIRSVIAAGAKVVDGNPDPSSMAKFHPKAIVADRRRALVTSANLTHLGQAKNIELGLLVEGEIAESIAALLERYCLSLSRAFASQG
jgi:phosphatidylserine/phosphatidylglycerophosphate/cardiolipin synthase-like enzyme